MAPEVQGGSPILRSFSWYSSLTTFKGRQLAGAFVVEGRRALSQIAARRPESILEILTVEKGEVRGARIAEAPLSRISEKQLRSVASSRTPQGTLAVVAIPEGIYGPTLPRRPGSRVLFLEDIQDPGNVGTLVRSAAALRFDGVLLTEKCADPFSPKSVQASAGSVLSVWIRRSRRCSEMVRDLMNSGFALVAADMAAGSTGLRIHDRPLILALGNEGNGLSGKYLSSADDVLSVSIDRSRAESLNVAAAGAICMYIIARESGRSGRVRQG